MERKSAWERWDEKKKKEAFAFCELYKTALSECKTERKWWRRTVEEARERGFRNLSEMQRLKPGDSFFKENRGRGGIVGILGKKPLSAGAKFIAAHIDCPRIDLKANPLYEDENLALFKTLYYGGIKKYQWFSLPLALYGHAVLKNGAVRPIAVGDADGDPVFVITDLLPHLAKDQMKKTIEDGFPGEGLNILAASIPEPGKEKERVKRAVLTLLKKKYGITEDDFFSAEFQAVPAGKARDLGFDRSMIIAYGQDDRVCSFTALRALFDAGKSDRSCFCILADQEEIGSRGSTSTQSSFIRNSIEEIMEKSGGNARDLKYCFERSRALSGDVDSLFDPNFKEVHDPRNAGRIGHGVIVSRTTGGRGKYASTEPTAQYLASLRSIFERRKICWQAGELGKGEQGGGGTVATYIALLNIDTIDCGTGVLSMHAPFEITGKSDVYSTYEAYKAFYQEE